MMSAFTLSVLQEKKMPMRRPVVNPLIKCFSFVTKRLIKT